MDSSISLEISQIPDYVFIGRSLDITIYARSGKSFLHGTHRLRASVINESTNCQVHHIIDPIAARLSEGFCSLVVKVVEGSKIDHTGRPSRFAFLVEVIDDQGNLILCQRSNPFICVLHQLRIYEQQSRKYEFFKDTGGKDKGIEFRVGLVDEEGKVVRGRDIAITPVLLYESGQLVQDQNILQTADDKSALIVRDGEAKDLKFRINQVSSKHLNQAFCIQIAPDLERCPLAADVMPATSVPVEVKSKIKRPQPEANVILKQTEQLSKKMRPDVADTHWNCPQDVVSQLLYSSQDLADAISIWRQWSHEVALSLETKIKWKPIGYESVPGHKSRTLLYEMTNPNETVNHLLQQYRDKVARSLVVLDSVSSMLQALPSSSLQEATTPTPFMQPSRPVPLTLPINDGSAPTGGEHHGATDMYMTSGMQPSNHLSQRMPSYSAEIMDVMNEAVFSLGEPRRPSEMEALPPAMSCAMPILPLPVENVGSSPGNIRDHDHEAKQST